ncbi:hypothetical protein WA158_004193 [Blastocystis sp. Blastoise]
MILHEVLFLYSTNGLLSSIFILTSVNSYFKLNVISCLLCIMKDLQLSLLPIERFSILNTSLKYKERIANQHVKSTAANTAITMKTITPETKRCGVIGLKVGMMPVWDRWGTRIPVTVVQVENCQVIQIKEEPQKKMIHLQVGAGPVKTKNVSKPLLGHYKAVHIEPKYKLVEFPVTRDAILPVGTELTCRHFLPGQYVNIQGQSIGKGFQGVMKRYGFAGQGATHGVSLTHRSLGSTGCRQDPGRVWKGQQMPGHMGNEKTTIQNLQVYKVEPERNLIYIRGSIPGNAGSYVKIFDSYTKNKDIPVPCPTYVKPASKESDLPLFAPSSATDPYTWM